jgi:6-pyruvoyltetrahydropterin/6-carboxytetrahydropterin synthase
MNMSKISKTYTFDAAHQLANHKGKCANLHGHTYSVTVWIKGELCGPEFPSSYGMVMDYASLDNIVKPIIDEMDHAFLTSLDEPIWIAISGASKAMGKVYIIPARTTAENVAEAIWGRLEMSWPGHVKLVGVIVSETPKTSAEYTGEVNT